MCDSANVVIQVKVSQFTKYKALTTSVVYHLGIHTSPPLTTIKFPGIPNRIQVYRPPPEWSLLPFQQLQQHLQYRPVKTKYSEFPRNNICRVAHPIRISHQSLQWVVVRHSLSTLFRWRKRVTCRMKWNSSPKNLKKFETTSMTRLDIYFFYIFLDTFTSEIETSSLRWFEFEN